MATNFSVKIGEIGRLTFNRRFGFPKGSGMSQFIFKRFNDNCFTTLFVNSVRLVPVTP